MPLFCTLASAYTGENTPSSTTFENRGYPLMFETSKKHMFFVDPGDNKSTKTVHKFYGAPLSLKNSFPSSAINLGFGGLFASLNTLNVSDHEIKQIWNYYQLPNETQLSLGRSTTSVSPSHGDSFTTISSVSVSNHKITPTYCTVNLPAETPLTIASNNVTDDYPDNGGSFQIMYSITKNSSHSFTWHYNDVFLPEFDLKLLNSAGNEIKYGPASYFDDEPTLEFGYMQDSIWSSIKKIKFRGAQYCKTSSELEINIVQKHSANHVFSASVPSTNNGKITLSSADSAGVNSTSFYLYGGNGIKVSKIGSNLLSISHDIMVGTDYCSGGSFTDYTSNKDSFLSFATGEATLNFGNYELIFRGSILQKGNPSNKFIIDTSHYNHGIDIYNGEAFITNDPSDSVNLVTWQNGSANGVGPVYDIKVVSSLPSDAASHPHTLYLVTGGGVTPEPTYNPSTTPEVRPSVNIVINTGVKSITVNGTNYTTSTIKQFPLGTTITWSATAQSGYYMTQPSSGSFENIITDITISPTANKNLVINPDPTFYPPSNKCSHGSPSRKTCYYANDPDAKAKIICDTNCGANNYVTV